MNYEAKSREQLIKELIRLAERIKELEKLQKWNVKALGAIRKSEAQYRGVVEDQTDLIARFLPGCILTFVNKAYCRYFKMTREELLSHSFLPMVTKKRQQAIQRRLSTLTPNNPVISYDMKVVSSRRGVIWQHWIDRGIFDASGKLIEYQAVGRDITKLKNKELDLKDSEKLLRVQKKNLEQKNVALKEILHQIDGEKNQFKEDMILNIDNLIMPIVKKIRSERGAARGKYIDLLENNLLEIVSSFGRKISEQQFRLTPREIEICNMVKNGLTSKEIANLLYISFNTVENHRVNIRKKLNIHNRRANLTTFLQNIPFSNKGTHRLN